MPEYIRTKEGSFVFSLLGITIKLLIGTHSQHNKYASISTMDFNNTSFCSFFC